MASAIPFPPTRWSLVGSVPHGTASLLVERYADCLLRYLRLRFPEVPAADLDDLYQEVLVHLLERPDLLAAASPQAGGRFRYYLATLALNQARNVLRGRRRQLHREQALLPADALDRGIPDAPDEQLDRAWNESVLAQAWADLRGWAASGELDPLTPTLLEEHLGGDVPLRELAERHGLSLATCQRRIARGRTWLRQAIEARRGEQ